MSQWRKSSGKKSGEGWEKKVEGRKNFVIVSSRVRERERKRVPYMGGGGKSALYSYQVLYQQYYYHYGTIGMLGVSVPRKKQERKNVYPLVAIVNVPKSFSITHVASLF